MLNITKGLETINFFFQNPQNLFGQQTTQPSYATNQRVTQKSCLELLLEFFFINQPEQLQELKNQTGFLTDSLVKLSSKLDSILYSQQMLETQISQVAQQVTSSSQPSGVFLSQTETNPEGPINAITLRDGKQLEELVVETNTIEVVVESEKPQGEKVVVDSEKLNTPPPYKSNISLPQGFDESKLDE